MMQREYLSITSSCLFCIAAACSIALQAVLKAGEVVPAVAPPGVTGTRKASVGWDSAKSTLAQSSGAWNANKYGLAGTMGAMFRRPFGTYGRGGTGLFAMCSCCSRMREMREDWWC